MLSELHTAAAATGVLKADDLKIRAQEFDHYLVAGEQKSFFHVTLYLLAGRTAQQKSALSEAIRKALVALLDDIHSLSVDIRDMDPDAYKKRLNP